MTEAPEWALWHHVDGKPNERTWRVYMQPDGAVVVEALDEAHGLVDTLTLRRNGSYIVPHISAPAAEELPSFVRWLQPIIDARARLHTLGHPVTATPILISSMRIELMVELGYLPQSAIEQKPGNASGAIHLFGVDCVWCKDLDIYAAVI